MEQLFLQALLLTDSTIRLATPLVLAALAGLFAERSGVVDIGLEGKMLGAAFGAAATAAVTGSAWLGLAAGIAFSILLALVHGFACITHQGNQVVSGMALNITVSGLTAVLGNAWFAQGGQTPAGGRPGQHQRTKRPSHMTASTVSVTATTVRTPYLSAWDGVRSLTCS